MTVVQGRCMVRRIKGGRYRLPRMTTSRHPEMRFNTSIAIALIAAFIVAMSLAAFTRTTPAVAQQGPPRAMPVTVAKPLAKRITQWDEYSGRFQAVETVEIRPRVSGFIDKVHFRDGQLVQAGDILFSIDPRPFEIAVESARAEIARFNAQVELQENEVDRATPLAKSGAVTGRDLDTRKTNLAVARAQLLAAQATLKAADLNLEWTQVKAPIAGRISDRKVDVGNLVTGGAAGATLLTTIVSLNPIHLSFDVSEADYQRYVRGFISGQRASGRDNQHPTRIRLSDEANWTLTGRLDFVDNQVNPRSGTLRARAIIDNAQQLYTPGVFARLQLWGGEIDALLIPDAAVISDQARKIVFVVGPEDVVRPAPITLGSIVDGLRVVSAGLTPDDRIVIDGLANPAVRPGVKIAPQPGEIKAAAN